MEKAVINSKKKFNGLCLTAGIFEKLAASVCTAGAVFLLQGCISQAEIDDANTVVTALPTEVKGCTFLGDIDADIGANASMARFYLKREAKKMGATHVVDNHSVAAVLAPSSVGLYFIGRAYRCPTGAGPLLPDK